MWNESLNHGIKQKEEEWIPFIENHVLTLPERKNCLEIGVNTGGTVMFLHFLFDKIYGIDIERNATLYLAEGKMDNYTHIVGASQLPYTIQRIKDLGVQFDMIFVDGDHSYTGAKLDYLSYLPFVKPGGIMVFHDIVDSERHQNLNCHVYTLWQEIKDSHKSLEIVSPLTTTSYNYQEHWIQETDARQWGGIGIIQL